MPQSGMFRFFSTKVVCCVFGQFISNHVVCRNQTTLQIGNTHEYTVRRQICCLSRANGVIVVSSGPDWCALGCSAPEGFGCVCSSHVSGWLTWGYVVALQNVGAQTGRSIDAIGQRRPPRTERTSRALKVGSQWHGCKCSWLEIDKIWSAFKKKKKNAPASRRCGPSRQVQFQGKCLFAKCQKKKNNECASPLLK